MSPRQDILTPVGRLVGGSLYKGSDKDADGKPRTIKTGANAGQPATQWFFMLAIQKGAERHWAETPWGQKIWACGHAAFPSAAQSPQFAWKVKDGDSTVPNRKGKKPCDIEGAKGHWLLSFASGFPPKVYNADGSQQILEPDAVKPGYYIQVFGSVDGNGSAQQPGVFLNHGMVALAAYGPEINLGMDASAVGFGAGAALPAGASAVPLTQAFNPAPPGAVVPPAPMPGIPAPTAAAPYTPAPPIPGSPAVPGAPIAPPMPPAVAVAPAPGFLAPPPPMPAPAVPVRRMTPAAGATTYEQYIAAGWTDALLVQHGMMLP
jgi:hypothetical protein